MIIAVMVEWEMNTKLMSNPKNQVFVFSGYKDDWYLHSMYEMVGEQMQYDNGWEWIYIVPKSYNLNLNKNQKFKMCLKSIF